MWKRIGSILRFSYNDNGALGLDSTCFATGTNIAYLCCVLNSPMGHYLLKDAPKTGTGDLLISVQAVEPLLVPFIAEDSYYSAILNMILSESDTKLESDVAEKIYQLYGLSEDEKQYIKSY